MTATFVPSQRKPIAALNWLGGRVGPRPDLSAAALRKKASSATGLAWPDDDDTEAALEMLTNSVRAEARLSYLGEWIIHGRMLGLLTTRLRVHDLLQRHPEIAEQPITPPLVIAGLQRTGTTMLHRLLAADPQTRSVQAWEAVSPLPHPKQHASKPDRRIRQALFAERALNYLSPQFAAIHAAEAEAPEEDVLLLEYSLRSQVPEAMVHVPTYAAWLAKQDMKPAYRYLKTLLQVLNWQDPRPQWVLKTPAHLEHLDTLIDVFGDAVIIQTHRDPLRTTASFSSMLAHSQSIFSDHVDAERLARHWLAKNAEMTDRARRVRQVYPGSFVDVSYYELIKDPMPQIERIYDHAGLVLTDESRAAIEASRSENKQHKHGTHKYTLVEFGLTEAEVDAAYRDYREYFGIKSEA